MGDESSVRFTRWKYHPVQAVGGDGIPRWAHSPLSLSLWPAKSDMTWIARVNRRLEISFQQFHSINPVYPCRLIANITVSPTFRSQAIGWAGASMGSCIQKAWGVYRYRWR